MSIPEAPRPRVGAGPSHRIGRGLALIGATVALVVPSLGAVAEDESGPAGAATEEAVVDADGSGVAEQAGTVPEVPQTTARGRYNLGLGHFDAGDYEAAAADFLASRDDAGPDPELRYRAAFNLGLSFAAQVGFGSVGNGGPAAETAAGQPDGSEGEAQSPEHVIETLRQSAAWFNDAVRLAPPEDDDARINLELVSKWILQLADQLNQGDRLQARLDRLIDDQRGLRDQVRRLLMDIAAEGAATEPVGFTTEFEALASRERVLMAEVGDVIDLATEERLHIEQTPPEQRPPEQQSRVHQLARATDYLERARQSLDDARRRLRRLEGERGHRRTDAALAELKRAREQLQDPVTVLKAVARDEQELIAHTGALAAFSDGTISLEGEIPGWLTDKHLAERQEAIGVRTGGVLSRFEAVMATDPAAVSGGDEAGMRRAVEAAEEAVPMLGEGLAAMRAAITALESGNAAAALPEQNRAIAAIAQAIELFADVKSLIELAYGTQQGIVGLLTPGEDEDQGALSADEREAVAGRLIADNQRRLERLKGLLEEEAAAATAEAQDAQSRSAVESRFELAESLRARAGDGLANLASSVDDGAVDDARANAAQTLAHLEELRRLFFSIVEHVAALLADQVETHDRTATLQAESSAAMGDEFAPAVAAAAERQSRHAQVGDALAAALAQQADAATAPAPNATGTPAASADPAAGERLAKAADEVRKAGGRMLSAATILGDGAVRATTMSPDLEPALTDQLAAMEHLENALQELVPPQQRQQQGEERQQGDAQQARPQSGEDEQMSQRQALKRLQAIRDREAERQRRRDGQTSPEPVEKDW
ncbi:MAG: hypothetical protein OXI79_16960 [Gammaproteobacteria bacterium]|nr:hypothetical protein [Gammaproteobacteria bacterium]